MMLIGCECIFVYVQNCQLIYNMRVCVCIYIYIYPVRMRMSGETFTNLMDFSDLSKV